MTAPFDWAEMVTDWFEVSSRAGSEHVGMPVTRPGYVDDYLSQIAGPNEQHEVASDGHCVNPKCRAPFSEADVDQEGWVTCPQCTHTQNLYQTKDSPGGMTRAGLTLEQMGSIGEKVVLRMGELPGVGAIVPASNGYNHPIDAVVEGQRGRFGCEIKTNHSQAQERFKIGGKEERAEKIKFCLENGLKPALIGVRLNFYTNKAFVFFREGLSDTWIGNQKMLHVATLDFADLNPFKSPDPQAQAMAVENANIPDQADEFDDVFGPVAAKVAAETAEDSRFTFQHDVHRLKIVNKSGQHTHTALRCLSCGGVNYVPVRFKGRIECSSCGKDAERDLRSAKVALGSPTDLDMVARKLGWNYKGRARTGHRLYDLADDKGTYHFVTAGTGLHGQPKQQENYLRQRMNRCMAGNCFHGPVDSPIQPLAETTPLIRAGETVEGNLVLEVEGGFALIQNLQSGQEGVVPIQQLHVGAGDWRS